jgi:PAS domain S-box-containing protein
MHSYAPSLEAQEPWMRSRSSSATKRIRDRRMVEKTHPLEESAETPSELHWRPRTALVERCSEGVAIVVDGQIRFANEALARICERDRASLIGSPLTMIIYPNDRHRFSDGSNIPLEGESPSAERVLRMVRADGTTCWVGMRVFEIEPDEAGELVVYVRDITDKRRYCEQHAHFEAHLRQQQKIEAISTLASGVAHEINNPINIVMNYAELIIARSEPESPIIPFAHEIIDESQRIATIVRNLLSFAREERENVQPAKVETIIETTLSLLREVLNRHDTELEVEIEENIPPIDCQVQQIQQVLMNLVTNSLDALKKHSKERGFDKRIAVRAAAREGFVRITVEDNGPGVPADIADRVFDPFFTTKPLDKGTGLGLAVSHGIVKKHGGSLTLESLPALTHV